MQINFEDYHSLVKAVVKKFDLKRFGYEEEDLINIGTAKVWQCTKIYDEKRGVKFSTLAYAAIKRRFIDIQKQGQSRSRPSSSSSINKDFVHHGGEIDYFDLLYDIESSLNEEQFKLFKKHYIEKVTYREIAKESGLHLSKIKREFINIKSIIEGYLKNV